MTQKGRTKDESFMMALYDLALNQGALDSQIDRYEVGTAAAMQKTAIDTICKQLLRTNFIRVGEESHLVYLTPHGLKLVESLHRDL
jgi:predicted transcriptional regulator